MKKRLLVSAVLVVAMLLVSVTAFAASTTFTDWKINPGGSSSSKYLTKSQDYTAPTISITKFTHVGDSGNSVSMYIYRNGTRISSSRTASGKMSASFTMTQSAYAGDRLELRGLSHSASLNVFYLSGTWNAY